MTEADGAKGRYTDILVTGAVAFLISLIMWVLSSDVILAIVTFVPIFVALLFTVIAYKHAADSKHILDRLDRNLGDLTYIFIRREGLC